MPNPPVPARIIQISVSPGGVPKRAVPHATVTRLGIDGDGHRHPEIHGGPDRALCLFALEAIEALQAEGHAVEPGALGENLTTAGLDWPSVRPGAVFRLGRDVLIQVTDFTNPCTTIRRSFIDGDYGRVSEHRHPGWSRVYARVVAPGGLSVGDAVTRVSPTAAC